MRTPCVFAHAQMCQRWGAHSEGVLRLHACAQSQRHACRHAGTYTSARLLLQQRNGGKRDALGSTGSVWLAPDRTPGRFRGLPQPVREVARCISRTRIHTHELTRADSQQLTNTRTSWQT
jgi:hypothetical protein